MLVRVALGGEDLDERSALLDKPLDCSAVDPCRRHRSAKTSLKTARPDTIASSIEMIWPRTSLCSASQPSAFARLAKKFSAGQQPLDESA